MAQSNIYGFDKAIKRLAGLEKLANKNMDRAMKINGSQLRDATKKTIRNGDGSWDPNSELTIEFKGSSKPLVDTGDLMNSIQSVRVSGGVYFVGVPEESTSEDGISMAGIAEVLEHGAVIKPKKGRALAVPANKEAKRLSIQYGGVRNIPNLFHPRNSSVLALPGKGDKFIVMFYLLSQVTIKPRSFSMSTYVRFRPVMEDTCLRAAKATLKGETFLR